MFSFILSDLSVNFCTLYETSSEIMTGYACRSVKKTYITLKKWGLGRSPKQGEGGSPTFSPFPGERGLGIGIENKHFFEKTDFLRKL